MSGLSRFLRRFADFLSCALCSLVDDDRPTSPPESVTLAELRARLEAQIDADDKAEARRRG